MTTLKKKDTVVNNQEKDKPYNNTTLDTDYSYAKPNSCRNFFNHNTSWQASVIDNATHFLSLNFEETTLPTKIIKYLDVDFLESMSLAMFASTFPSNTDWLSPNFRQTLQVPLRYHRIHSRASQLSLPGFERKWLTTPIVWAMLGLVHTIIYIKLLTAKAYGICFISSCSFSLVGHCLELSLKWHASGVDRDYF